MCGFGARAHAPGPYAPAAAPQGFPKEAAGIARISLSRGHRRETVLRAIQARLEDALRVLGSSSQEQTDAGSRTWTCGCIVTARLGNEALCDWQMCARHASLAPQMEIGGG
jgi:hypothetical protein